MAERKKPTKISSNAIARQATELLATADPEGLLSDLQLLIRQTREQVAQAVNSALVLLYWQVGHRIRSEVLRSQRADYGEAVIRNLAEKLTLEFGNGFSRPNLFRMLR